MTMDATAYRQLSIEQKRGDTPFRPLTFAYIGKA
jgi:hypothetical protein